MKIERKYESDLEKRAEDLEVAKDKRLDYEHNNLKRNRKLVYAVIFVAGTVSGYLMNEAFHRYASLPCSNFIHIPNLDVSGGL